MKYILAIILIVSATTGFSQKYNIIDFGAAGDETTMNTTYIQKAIDECHKNGGTVVVPPGIFLTGTLILKNNVALEITHGAILKASPYVKDFPQTIPSYRSYSDNFVTQSLIYAEKADNISISGSGTIDGSGDAPDFAVNRWLVRPYVIRFIQCTNIKIEGVRLINSPMWMQHYLACENLLISNIDVYNHGNRNNDGLDIDGCKNVVISNCIIDSDDDALCFKSTGPAICENITVTNCIVSSHCNNIKFGTETTGGFKNVSITNCVVKQSANDSVIYGTREGQSGLALEIVDGGIMDGIVISNISIDSVEVPIFIRLGNRARKHTETAPEPEVGILKNIQISNVIARDAGVISSSITGIPGFYLDNINLSDITIISNGGGKSIDVNGIIENEDSYPSPYIFKSDLPSYGLYIRHAKNVTMRNINLIMDGKDERVALVLDDVINGQFRDLRTAGLGEQQTKVWLHNAREIEMNDMEEIFIKRSH